MLSKEELNQSIERFIDWHESNGDLSFDRMDYWSSKTGIFAKKLFYKNKLLGAPFALIGLLLENYFPTVQKLFSKPHREIIGDAHFAMGYLNLFEQTEDPKYLRKAESLLDAMLSYSSKGYSGLTWGYSFGWQTINGFWGPGVPMITITPYAFWAFSKHYRLTREDQSLINALSIADFTLNDLNEKPMPNGTFSSSYSPVTEDIVINANTYRAAVLMEAYELSGKESYKAQADRCIDFVISYQNEDGSWYYEAKGASNNFIDNFHTCFVLRNLTRCYHVSKDERTLNAIEKGYLYYRDALFFNDGHPKHFSVSKYFKLRKYEMYDFAEGITLGIELENYVDGALDWSKKLADLLTSKYQLKKGYFVTRIASGGIRHTVPYLRWPQAQIFYALTSLKNRVD